MNINDIRKIGRRLMAEIPAQLKELRKGEALGRGAGGDKTYPVDKKAEEIIIGEAERLGMPLTIISEECGIKEINGGGHRLLIDPIDGSRNAVSGMPLFSTSLALLNGDNLGDAYLGYVLNLINGDEYWAVRCEGAFLNGEQISAQNENLLKVIAYEAQTPRIDIPKITPLLSLYNRTRCLGSTALDLALLSAGALSTVIIPYPTRSFDMAAGCLLVNEAGGIVSDLNGDEIEKIKIGVERATPVLASANEEVHAVALETLRKSNINK
ncbi:MAG: hypothetical protein HY809_06770 [Nitrospirae bacterium]|nr:hypothetical protein [Nitrospirota bacterium]